MSTTFFVIIRKNFCNGALKRPHDKIGNYIKEMRSAKRRDHDIKGELEDANFVREHLVAKKKRR